MGAGALLESEDDLVAAQEFGAVVSAGLVRVYVEVACVRVALDQEALVLGVEDGDLVVLVGSSCPWA